MSCFMENVDIYLLVENTDEEGYENPGYNKGQSFKADVQSMSGEKALKEYGISQAKIALGLYPPQSVKGTFSSEPYSDLVKIDGFYYDINFIDHDGWELVVTKHKGNVREVVVSP